MYLEIDDVSKIFPARGGGKEVVAVNHVSLNIEKGEFVTMLGPSGCGKTTMLRIVAGFEFPTSGNIILDGRNLNQVPTHKRDMSMVFQSYAIFPHLNVHDNIAYGLNVQKVPAEAQKKRVQRVLEMVHLEGYENRAPNQLSGGQQQRVALARALIMEPKVLLMDEPLSNLDTKLREAMRFEIRELQRNLGFTCLYVTHDQLEAMVLSDKALIMNAGSIEQYGSPREIYRYPKTRFVADFIGRANFLPGMIAGHDGDTVHTRMGELTIAISDPVYRDLAVGEDVDVVLRPEIIKVDRREGSAKAVVLQSAYLGESVEYILEYLGQKISAKETDPTRLTVIPAGTEVRISFPESCVHLIRRKA